MDRLIRENAARVFDHIKLNEIDAEEVSVAGFEFKDTLAPTIWTSQASMRPDTRDALLEIAGDFAESIPAEVDVIDIKLTGSLANYNWSRFSDVDLHLVIDFSQIDDDIEFVRSFFNYKKTVWNIKHEIYIGGYEVEIYVENVGDRHISTGVYSILEDGWITEPTTQTEIEIDVDAVKKKAASIMFQIDYVEEIAKEEPAEAEAMAERVKEKVRNMRQSGLESEDGQYSAKNVAFKVLRRNGYLEKLSDIKTQAYDSLMSID
tara:strand:+ start:399 stop:1184 length:786 start_codon:yes stop_codon:yes gene_type:complete